MSLGGGSFEMQNKVLPGAYINFVSTKTGAASLSERGVATMPLLMDWGAEDSVFEVTAEDFQKNSLKIFGYAYDHEKLKPLRDLFRNIKLLYAYRLNGTGTKASNKYATAKYAGIRGNDITIVIKANIDQPELFDVETLMDTTVVDKQTVKTANELKANDFVEWKTFEIANEAGLKLSTGANASVVNGSNHQAYLDKIESYSFNTIGVDTTDDTTKGLYVNFCKRMRDEIGAKFQLVVYNKAADYEGVVNVKNKVKELEPALVYWVTGIIAGCAVNKSNLNKIYDGEFSVEANYTQNELIKAIEAGEFALHKVNNDIRVLEDINSLTTITDVKGEDFKSNQTIRVIDQIANDIAVLFNNKYLGNIPNDAAGRVSLWSDIVKHHEQLEEIRAIENFSDKDVVIEQGDSKKAVVVSDAVTIVGCMAKLYMTVKVS